MRTDLQKVILGATAVGGAAAGGVALYKHFKKKKKMKKSRRAMRESTFSLIDDDSVSEYDEFVAEALSIADIIVDIIQEEIDQESISADDAYDAVIAITLLENMMNDFSEDSEILVESSVAFPNDELERREREKAALLAKRRYGFPMFESPDDDSILTLLVD